jgi:hypothetical protein
VDMQDVEGVDVDMRIEAAPPTKSPPRASKKQRREGPVHGRDGSAQSGHASGVSSAHHRTTGGPSASRASASRRRRGGRHGNLSRGGGSNGIVAQSVDLESHSSGTMSLIRSASGPGGLTINTGAANVP